MMPYNMRTCGSNAMVREYAGGSLNGILRKTGAAAGGAATASGVGANGLPYGAASTDPRQPPLELLVFGYACKIFRDDEKAREMDHGKQLIPWMGDVNLKIDRYDVRGALCELSTYEAPPGGYGNRLEYLSAEEQRAEQLCEEERYLFLYNNEEELRLQQEEDLKRLQQETSGGNYSQVDFHYDGQSTCSSSGADAVTSPTSESSTPAEESELPYTLPPSLLVAPAPGMQLPETMKQHAIIEKTARFIATQGAQMEILIKAKQANNAQFDFLSQGGQLQPYYRHLLSAIKQGKYAASAPPATTDTANGAGEGSASLSSPKRSQQIITVPTIKYKPSANCAYTQLISKIKGVPLQTVLDDENASQHSNGTASPTPSCKSEGQSQSSIAAPASNGEFTPVLLQYNGSTFAHEAEEDNANDAPPKVELLKNTSALALAQNYSSDSDDEQDADDDNSKQGSQEATQTVTATATPTTATKKTTAVLAPPPLLTFPLPEETLRHIIDKTATYVIKNGRQFEETLRTKSVERFNFLLPDHKFYAYYMYKITGDVDAASKEEKTRKAAAVAAALISKKGLGGANATAGAGATEKAHVSFAIRARDENASLQPVLPLEASDDDELKAKSSAEQARPGMPDSVQRAIKQVETQLLARTGAPKATPATTASSPLKEQRQAEERVKDKLAQIARDKLNGIMSREKQLQLERKRKAMAFLNQIKCEGTAIGTGLDALTTETAAANADSVAAAANINGDSNDSVRSIPITYFGPDDDEDDDDEDDDDEDNDVGVRTAAAPPPIRTAYAEDDEDEDGDLEKYNLLNDDSTNTFTSKVAAASAAAAAAAPVLLSDDDDVQLVSAAAAPQSVSAASSAGRHRKTGRRSRSHSSSSCCSITQDASVTSSSSSPSCRRSRSRSRSAHRQRRKRKSSAIAKHRHRRRSRSASRSSRHKQRSRSRSSSHSCLRRHRDHKEETLSRRRNHQRQPSKKSHKRHKRRRRSSGGSASQ
ncbi:protein suppressor of white apricot isoform X1 [Drosophila montana]|uniref:protein suppressor of white apricot isoform X1 n=1 Tax=Drosophila montana TaxID=40370 RepID=UPI00313ACB44